ncbi:nitrate- and nitrite sensing domain-containing protein [Microtetraspora sp. NBRC 13810]|uniref:sensor histidine kinase n=1 Tax=Microtetraspora sp. NBRC 13810 TaxID=3030990 RepID=UPI002555164B|nr:nitrate- and nitrite sensing domain-containing protein [Microtetraspora sp. NBRC 13810]
MPTAVAVFLAGARVYESVDSITTLERTGLAAEYSANIRALAEALGQERDMGAWTGYARSAKIDGKQVNLESAWQDRQKVVDGLSTKVIADFDKVDSSFGARVVEAIAQAKTQLTGLADLRKQQPVQVPAYTSLITGLLAAHDELATVADDSITVGDMRGLSSLAHAKEEASKQRVRLVIGRFEPRLVTSQEMEDFIASRSRQGEHLAEFGGEAGIENVQLLYRTLTDPRRYNAELTKSRAIAIQASGKRIAQGSLVSDVAEWYDDNTVTIDLIAKVEEKVADDVVARNQELVGAEQRNAAIAGASILLLLLLVLALTVFIARSMVSPLRRLRTEALEVAGFRLPNVVRDMRVTGDATPPDIQPISVNSTDEIGEVAQAFDEVHRQAVRLAGEEAELRGNISSMFVNLSRRTQTLVERQISLIDGLEKGEEDGKRLGDLFKLDHLATRMRRNSENLLVLAGHEPTRRRSQPAKLVDVVRASLSEVEDYERVQVKVHRTTSVVGSAANDLVHLVAELVENAIQFSPRNTQVTVSSSLIEGGGALLSVTDQGIGMTEEELTEANRRLAEPPVVDVSVSRRMGLFVVGRLALRHGIRAQLRLAESNGLIAMVLIPPTLIVDSAATQQNPTPSWGSTGTAPAAAGAGPAQGFGPFQPAGQGASGSLFGSETPLRREFSGQPAGGDSRRPQPASSGQGFGGPQRGFGAPTPMDNDPFNKVQDPFNSNAGDPFTSHASDPFARIDPFNSQAGDPFASQGAGDSFGGGRSGDPFASQSGDPFASQSGDPFASRGGDPFASQSGDPFASRGSDPFASQGAGDSFGGGRSGDPFASQSGDPFASRGGDPFASQAGDPFASRGGDPFASQAGDPFASRGGDPFASQAGDSFGGQADPFASQSGSFGRTPPGATADPGFRRQQPPAGSASSSADTGVFSRPETAPSARPEGFGGDQSRGAQPFSPWTSHDDDPITASMPVVEVSSLESEEEYLPIFASVESAWFRKADVPAAPEEPVVSEEERAERAKREENERLEEWESARAAVSAPPEPPQARPAAPAASDWRTPADEGWRAAAAAAEPTMGGITSAGLPKRTPKANLVPGRAAATPAPSAAPPMPPLSADRVRSRMASLQQGVRRGRAEVRDDSAGIRADKEEGE